MLGEPALKKVWKAYATVGWLFSTRTTSLPSPPGAKDAEGL